MFCVEAFRFFVDHLATSPYDYLEIGIYDGSSVLDLAERFSHKTIYAIDPFVEDGHTSMHSGVPRGSSLIAQRTSFFENLKVKNVMLFEMTSKQFLENVDLGQLNVGSVLVDGSHHYEDVLVDIQICELLLAGKDGCIVFDDAEYIADVKRGVGYFREAYGSFITDEINLRANGEVRLFKTLLPVPPQTTGSAGRTR